MSEGGNVSSLPLPPAHYIALYSDENIRRGRAPPAPRPAHDTYTMFGNTFNADDTIIRSLESQVLPSTFIFCCNRLFSFMIRIVCVLGVPETVSYPFR